MMNNLRIGKSGKYFLNVDYTIKNEEPIKKFLNDEAFLDTLGLKDHIYGLSLGLISTGEGKQAEYSIRVNIIWNKSIHKSNSFNLVTSKKILDTFDDIDTFMDSVEASIDVKNLVEKISGMQSKVVELTEMANNYIGILSETINFSSFKEQMESSN